MQPRKYSIPAMGTLTLAATMGAGCADEFEGIEGDWTGLRLNMGGEVYDLPYTYTYDGEGYSITSIFDTRLSVDDEGNTEFVVEQEVLVDDQLYTTYTSSYDGVASKDDDEDIWRIPLDPDDPEGNAIILECAEGSQADTLVCDELESDGTFTGNVWTFQR